MCEMSKEERDAINPEALCVGIAAAAAYINKTWKMPIAAADLESYIDLGKGPPVHEMWDGVPTYAKRTIDVWVICQYGAHDGTETGKQAMIFCYLGNDAGGDYSPTYDPSTGRVGLEFHPHEKP
jgi:hypothetical protein